MDQGKSNEVDAYIAALPERTQALLRQIRATIQQAAPEAEEVISYGMPAYKLGRILVYFAGCTNHIGFYPTATGIEAFKQEFSRYKWSKGAVQFPIEEPLPIDLIKRIVKFKVRESQERSRTAKAGKASKAAT